MKIGIRALTMMAIGLCALTTAAGTSVRPAAAQGMTWQMWCVVPDFRTGTAYYSSIFTSSDADSYGHAVPFTNFVQNRYSQTAQLGQCYTYENYGNAQEAKKLEMSRTVYDSHIDTSWRP